MYSGVLVLGSVWLGSACGGREGIWGGGGDGRGREVEM